MISLRQKSGKALESKRFSHYGKSPEERVFGRADKVGDCFVWNGPPLYLKANTELQPMKGTQ